MADQRSFRTGWRSLAVSGCGVAAAIAVAAGVVLVDRLTSFNLYGLSLWVVIPVGAFLTGIAAASGYYFASLYFHTRAGWSVAAQMVLAACIANFLIYYLDYYTLELDGVTIHDRITFTHYMSVMLTHQEMRFGRAMVKAGEVGDFGYWLAFFDFLGFVAGGASIFLFLSQRQTCESCPRYLRERTKANRYFESAEAVGEYYDDLFSRPMNDPDFAKQAMLGAFKPFKSKIGFRVETKIMECPECSRQTWNDVVQVWNGREWKDVSGLTRRVSMPLGTNAVPFVAARRAKAASVG